MASTARRFRLYACFVLALSAIAGCKGGGQESVAAPDKLYDLASQDLRSNNFKGAIAKLEALESHYPFTNAARQGQLDLMFAYYRNREPESAIDQAEPERAHAIALLAALSKRTNFSVGCYCEDESHCHRSVLRELLAAQGAALQA